MKRLTLPLMIERTLFTSFCQSVLRVRVGTPMDDVEEAYIHLALNYTKNNKHRAAELLGISLRNLHNKVRAYAQRNSMAASANSSEG